MVDIVRKIDMIRIKKDWTIYKLCEEADITQAAFHKWLNNGAMPTIPAIKKVCDALGITMAELFAENELVELSPEVKALYDDWRCLTKDEQASIKQIVNNYIKSKQK